MEFSGVHRARRNALDGGNFNIGFLKCRDILAHVCGRRITLAIYNFCDDFARPFRIVCEPRGQHNKFIFTLCNSVGYAKVSEDAISGAFGIARAFQRNDRNVHVQCGKRRIATGIGKGIENGIHAPISRALFGVVTVSGNEYHARVIYVCTSANAKYQWLVGFVIRGERKLRTRDRIEDSLPRVKATRRQLDWVDECSKYEILFNT